MFLGGLGTTKGGNVCKSLALKIRMKNEKIRNWERSVSILESWIRVSELNWSGYGGKSSDGGYVVEWGGNSKRSKCILDVEVRKLLIRRGLSVREGVEITENK